MNLSQETCCHERMHKMHTGSYTFGGKEHETEKLVKTVILVLSAAMIGGCGAQGSNQGDSQAVQETSAAVSESQSSSDGAYEPVTIVNGEREITFTKMPQKVLCANLYAAENMVMLGLGDRVVGRIAPANPAERPLPELEDEFAAIPEVEKSHENAVALGTDLVIGQVSAFKESAWGSYDQLESKGIQCLTITGTIVPDETVEHIYTDIENLGKIFKVEDRAEELIEDIRSQIEETQKQFLLYRRMKNRRYLFLIHLREMKFTQPQRDCRAT